MEFNFHRDIILENDRVRLSPMKPGDHAGLMLVAENNPSLVRYSPILIHTAEYLNEYMGNAMLGREKKRRYPFTIFDKKSGRIAGTTSFMSFSLADHRLEIGSTWIGYDFQGTGLNPNCKLLMLEHCFEALRAERVEFLTDSRNIQSRSAIEKIGASYEGLLRSHINMPDGVRRSSCCYSIIKEEWPQVKPGLMQRATGKV